jgi:uracil phosphoribosyltransferase
MAIEDREHAAVVTHALAQHVLSDLRRVETAQPAFRDGLVRIGRICGAELVDEYFQARDVQVQTPLVKTTSPQVTGLDDVVLINILRAATPFVEGLLDVFPEARQGVISASRDEEAGMTEDGAFPIAVQYRKLPDIRPGEMVIVADPMLATGSTAAAVLEEVLADAPESAHVILLSAVSAAPGLQRIDEQFHDVELVTVSIDDHLNDDGFIVPGLGDAGDRAFGTD